MGSINGSAVANVASTGTFTIPMMKDRGYEPHYAGAVESVASTGGMIMPPVMGVGAFIMSGIIGVPYAKIALCALIPALFYYVTCGVSVHLRALRNGFKPLPDELIPNKKELFKKDGIFFLPLLAIIILLMSGTSVMRSAFLGCIVLVLCYLLKNSVRNPKFILTKDFWMFLYNGLVIGAKSAMTVAAACAAMGIVTQIFVMTGLAMNIVFFIKTLSGNVGILALILTMAVTILFGMGVPTTAAYVLVASLAGSVLIELGFDKIAVHLFIYYYAALANITPPVASAALVASKIAKSDYFKTAATATRLGLPGFILPFMFAYHQELFLTGQHHIDHQHRALLCHRPVLYVCLLRGLHLPQADGGGAGPDGPVCHLRHRSRFLYGHFLLCYLYRRGRRTVHAEQKSEESSNLKTKRNLC
ncbi:MAG: TRAP transporter fused permease subunit [Lawsonibacter sp.]